MPPVNSNEPLPLRMVTPGPSGPTRSGRIDGLIAISSISAGAWGSGASKSGSQPWLFLSFVQAECRDGKRGIEIAAQVRPCVDRHIADFNRAIPVLEKVSEFPDLPDGDLFEGDIKEALLCGGVSV